MSVHADAVRVLTQWHPPNDGQRKLQATYLHHLAEHPDGVLRECHPDHLTASCLVVSTDRQHVMLNLHRRYQIWVQFGGHCDPTDTSLADAALREAVEESGIGALRLVSGSPVQLSTHEVECGPLRPSHHLDVRYVAVAPDGTSPVISDESLDVRWFSRGTTPVSIDRSLRELIGLARWI
ncbi:MAG: NUDIX domain-containing protein [Nocardioidaceae bacterium]|nr:NUDIX domain-containing protein [Nocardioidaceae bacterium]